MLLPRAHIHKAFDLSAKRTPKLHLSFLSAKTYLQLG